MTRYADYMNYGWNPASITDIPVSLQAWISKTQNLTQALRLHQLAIELALLSQGTATLPLAEAELLGSAYGLVRQIYLKDTKHIYIYGRTIVPQATLTAYAEDFAKLGNSPIGDALLHHNPKVQRSAFEFGYVLPDSLLYQDAVHAYTAQPEKLWARRSTFSLAGLPLLITELFFPELPAYALPEYSA
jgi:chorismate--pyruvate lyase